MMFHQPLFSEGPESFNTVDVNFPLFKFVPMIGIEMAIPAEHERIVSSPFICVHNQSAGGWGDGTFVAPSGFAVDSSGNVYVADTANNRIQKFSRSFSPTENGVFRLSIHTFYLKKGTTTTACS